MAKAITCPVCFTKMNHIGHDLVCPECGYKYCEGRIPYTYDDHNHDQYQTYNQKTTYTSGPVSSQSNYAARSTTASQSSYAVRSTTTSQYTRPTPAVPRPQTPTTQGQGSKPNPKVAKVVWFIVIIYILSILSRLIFGR